MSLVNAGNMMVSILPQQDSIIHKVRDRMSIEPTKKKSLLKVLEIWEPSGETLPDVAQGLLPLDGVRDIMQTDQLASGFQWKTNIFANFVPGLDETEMPDTMALIKLTREGLPGSTINKLAEAFQIPKSEMCRLLDMSPKTGKGAEEKKLSKSKTDQFIQIIKVLWKADKLFKDHEKAIRCLKSPCHAIGDQVPIHLLDTTEGILLVMKTLGRMEYGIFC